MFFFIFARVFVTRGVFSNRFSLPKSKSFLGVWYFPIYPLLCIYIIVLKLHQFTSSKRQFWSNWFYFENENARLENFCQVMFCCLIFTEFESNKHRSIEFLTTQTDQSKRYILIDYVLTNNSPYLASHLRLSFDFTFIHLNSWKPFRFSCFYLEFLTKRDCLYFQSVRFQLRRYRSGYFWNRKLWRMSVDSIQALSSTNSTQIESS